MTKMKKLRQYPTVFKSLAKTINSELRKNIPIRSEGI